jgi:hypothetical protein
MNPNPEMGRELLAHELVVQTVVVIGREDRPIAVTAWVKELGEDFVAFYAGETHALLIVFRHKDGTLADDTETRIHVWEYLGTV